ncbi:MULTISPECIES: DUF4006 family protein [unclassified Helicobacter]|uniref:DUF4006 family protein n=1 Tax=unclassified Helicobacter TaxID=2593540 RepID=UPI000CF099A2|nr:MULTISPECIES: DUF4006 family protein [unclassified Helicobacter]
MNRLFGLNGLLGLLIAVALVIGIVIVLGYIGVNIQQREANNYYSLDIGAIEMKDAKNSQHYKLTKE